MRSNKPGSVTCRCRVMLRSFLNCVSGWEYITAFTCGKNKLWCSSQDSRAGKINTSTNIFGSTRSHRLTHQGFFANQQRGKEKWYLRLNIEDCTCPYSPSQQMGIRRKNRKEILVSTATLRWRMCSPQLTITMHHIFPSHISCLLIAWGKCSEGKAQLDRGWVWHLDADRAGTAAKRDGAGGVRE